MRHFLALSQELGLRTLFSIRPDIFLRFGNTFAGKRSDRRGILQHFAVFFSQLSIAAHGGFCF